jgi:hypothetical protein
MIRSLRICRVGWLQSGGVSEAEFAHRTVQNVAPGANLLDAEFFSGASESRGRLFGCELFCPRLVGIGALENRVTQLQQTGGFGYAQPPAYCILNHFHRLELSLTRPHQTG